MTYVNVSCQVCGDDIGKQRESTPNKRKYCSQQCSARGRRLEAFKQIEAGNASVTHNATVKAYLVEARGDCCEKCGSDPIWNGEPLVMQVDHIDGDHNNSLPSNLRLLCPNCHSQTGTFGSKNQNRPEESKRRQYRQKYRQKLKINSSPEVAEMD